MTWLRLLQGSRDGSVVRAVASHQCDLSLILIKCHVWVELLVLLLLSRFFCRYSDFPLSWKTTTSKFQFDQHILGPAWKPAKAVAVLSLILISFIFLFRMYNAFCGNFCTVQIQYHYNSDWRPNTVLKCPDPFRYKFLCLVTKICNGKHQVIVALYLLQLLARMTQERVKLKLASRRTKVIVIDCCTYKTLRGYFCHMQRFLQVSK